MANFNFEVYRRRHASTSGGVWVTILSHGDISLSREAFGALGSPGKVEVLYDVAALRLGIRPATEPATEMEVVHGRRVAGARHALAYFGVTERSVRYEASVSDDPAGPLLVVDLCRPSVPVSKGRVGPARPAGPPVAQEPLDS